VELDLRHLADHELGGGVHDPPRDEMAADAGAVAPREADMDVQAVGNRAFLGRAQLMRRTDNSLTMG
jgi:hypothetical protein